MPNAKTLTTVVTALLLNGCFYIDPCDPSSPLWLNLTTQQKEACEQCGEPVGCDGTTGPELDGPFSCHTEIRGAYNICVDQHDMGHDDMVYHWVNGEMFEVFTMQSCDLATWYPARWKYQNPDAAVAICNTPDTNYHATDAIALICGNGTSITEETLWSPCWLPKYGWGSDDMSTLRPHARGLACTDFVCSDDVDECWCSCSTDEDCKSNVVGQGPHPEWACVDGGCIYPNWGGGE